MGNSWHGYRMQCIVATKGRSYYIRARALYSSFFSFKCIVAANGMKYISYYIRARALWL